MKKAIDISSYQKNVNYEAVKNSGIEMVILRAGYTGYGTAKSKQKDCLFDTHYDGFRKVGIPVGVYWYSCAYTKEEARGEANKILSIIKGKQIELPIFMDVEDSHDVKKKGNAPQNQSNLGKQKLTEVVDAFCKRIEEAGYYVGIYANTCFLNTKLDMNVLKRYDVWVAHWNTSKPAYKGKYCVWQYSSRGKINGIRGNVDLDEVYLEYPSIIREKGLNNLKNKNQTMIPEKKEKIYTVKKGDTLTFIASKFHMSWKQLYHDNKTIIGSDPNKIYPNQKLVIK